MVCLVKFIFILFHFIWRRNTDTSKANSLGPDQIPYFAKYAKKNRIDAFYYLLARVNNIENYPFYACIQLVKSLII